MEYNVTYREKNKSVQCIISYKNNDGEWKTKSKQGFRIQKDAKPWIETTVEELEEMLENETKLDVEYKDITFKEFKDIYIKHLELHREYYTILNYKTTFDKFAKLNDKPLDQIKQIDIQIIVDGMVKTGLSRGTIRDNLKRINTVFMAAVKQYKAITKNPIENIKDIVIPQSKTKEKMKALTKAELDTLLDNISPSNDYIITLIAATCGLRIGEILGLTWDNVDFSKEILTVEKQWKELKKGVYGFGSLKSANSNRNVPIPPKTIAALKQYKSNLKVLPLDNRIVRDKQSKSTTSTLIKKYRNLGFNISVHDLRHTYATMLIANGVDFKTVAKILGHRVEMTMKIYSHVNQDMIDAATLKIQKIF